jgi:hypothetical protein
MDTDERAVDTAAQAGHLAGRCRGALRTGKLQNQRTPTSQGGRQSLGVRSHGHADTRADTERPGPSAHWTPHRTPAASQVDTSREPGRLVGHPARTPAPMGVHPVQAAAKRVDGSGRCHPADGRWWGAATARRPAAPAQSAGPAAAPARSSSPAAQAPAPPQTSRPQTGAPARRPAASRRSRRGRPHRGRRRPSPTSRLARRAAHRPGPRGTPARRVGGRGGRCAARRPGCRRVGDVGVQ